MLRVKDWIKSYFWVPLVGVFLVSFSFRDFFLVAIIYFCAISYAYVINNYFDAEIDKKHQGKIRTNRNPLAQGLITKKNTLMLLGILLLIPLVLAIQMSFIGFIFVLLSIIFSTLYSVKIFRLKEKLMIDIITNGLVGGFFPFLAGVALAGGTFNLYFLLIGILFTILVASSLLAHQIADYDKDIGNTKNTVIKIGQRISYIFLVLFHLVFLLCFLMVLNYFTIEWWLYYLFIFLSFAIPLYYLKEIKNKHIGQLLNNTFKI